MNDSISDSQSQSRNRPFKWSTTPLWDLPFRPWFLFCAFFSIINVILWTLHLHQVPSFTDRLSISPLVWHIHEMLFGFGITIAAAFLLTASQTWTGQRSLHGLPLAALTIILIVVRCLFFSPREDSLYLLILFQGLWWVGVIGTLTLVLWRGNNSRNFIFIPFLIVLMGFNLALLLLEHQGNTVIALHLSQTSIFFFSLIVTIIGGRIIPFFTVRKVPKSKAKSYLPLEVAVIFLTLALALIFFITGIKPLPFSLGTPFIALGLIHLVRLYFWDVWSSRQHALLWSLHVSYGVMGLAYIAIGFSLISPHFYLGDALHVMTIGTFGCMILSVMSRVSLGHTGRDIVAPKFIPLALVCLLLAGFLRWLLPLIGKDAIGWDISAFLWVIAFSIFIAHYLKILTKE